MQHCPQNPLIAARIRSRFEQHLSPEVVKRIAENPGLLKLGGEKREITALFTDIEDFTAMTHRAGPEQLVAVLDEYIEGMTAIFRDVQDLVPLSAVRVDPWTSTFSPSNSIPMARG